MATISLTWKDLNIGEDGFNIYRSETPMDVNNMPAPIATVGPNIGSYDDTTGVVGNMYYYRVGVIRNGEEQITKEIPRFSGEKYIYMWGYNSGITQNIFYKFDFAGEIVETTVSSYNLVNPLYLVDNRIVAKNGSYEIKVFDLNLNEILTFSLLESGFQRCNNIGVDTNGNFYLATVENEVVKVDSNNNVVWVKSPHTTGEDAYIGHIDHNNNIYTYGNYYDNHRIVKSDENGNKIWEYTEGLKIQSIVVDTNENMYISTNDSYGRIVAKIDKNGNQKIWERTINTYPCKNMTLADDGIILHSEQKLIKIDFDGNTIWEYAVYRDVGHIKQDDYGFIYAKAASALLKLNSNGNLIWQKNIDYSNYTNGFIIL